MITTCFQFVGQTEEDIERSMNIEYSCGCVYPIAVFSSQTKALLMLTEMKGQVCVPYGQNLYLRI